MNMKLSKQKDEKWEHKKELKKKNMTVLRCVSLKRISESHIQLLICVSSSDLWQTASFSEQSTTDPLDCWSLYKPWVVYENDPLPRRLGVWILLFSRDSVDTSGKHWGESNSSGGQSAIASQSAASVTLFHNNHTQCTLWKIITGNKNYNDPCKIIIGKQNYNPAPKKFLLFQ